MTEISIAQLEQWLQENKTHELARRYRGCEIQEMQGGGYTQRAEPPPGRASQYRCTGSADLRRVSTSDGGQPVRPRVALSFLFVGGRRGVEQHT